MQKNIKKTANPKCKGLYMKCKGLYMKCKTSVDMILIIWFNTINIKNQPERDVSEWQDQKR